MYSSIIVALHKICSFKIVCSHNANKTSFFLFLAQNALKDQKNNTSSNAK